jgi:hypothetical protein
MIVADSQNNPTLVRRKSKLQDNPFKRSWASYDILFCSLARTTVRAKKMSCHGPHTLKLVAIPILPLPAVTGYYLSPRHEKFIFRPFAGETEGHHVLSQLFDWLYLPHFLLLKWVVVKYNGVCVCVCVCVWCCRCVCSDTRFTNLTFCYLKTEQM